jgi:formylglycine-generating enzyme required for sulfatase activity
MDDIRVDVQCPWEDSPRRFHENLIHLQPFLIDKYPVTNAEFKKLMDASHYHPQDGLNFLRIGRAEAERISRKGSGGGTPWGFTS